jgi:acyl-CoA synthetase (AMP-forming)/AMP-acid ligase II
VPVHVLRDKTLRSPRGSDIAFLQYTSGSTSTPRGVMISHDNLLENLEMIRLGLGNTRQSIHSSWVPLYHDMGLTLNVLQSFYVGALGVLLSPVAFLQRPTMWLRAIHEYRVEVTCAPNFAFDHCVSRFREEQMKDVDLSCWKVAVNAAEPVRAETIERFVARFGRYGFDVRAMSPLYGLAEATVGVSFRHRGSGVKTRRVSRDALQRNEIANATSDQDVRVIVGCGCVTAAQQIAIVDPARRRRLGVDQIGEVWTSGPNVARGYWHKTEATELVFHGYIAHEDGTRWLRTGDLGFLDEDGELYITGRIKDVIIIRGTNHYPQDIENTVQNSNPALRPHYGAAFAVAEEGGREKLVIVQEVERTHRHRVAVEDIVGDIREAVANEHEIAVDHVVLINPGAIPKTTSGKIQRSLTRQLWLQGALDVVR